MSDKQDKSIVPEKYREKYRGPGDWVKQFMTAQVTKPKTKEVDVKDEDGNVVGTDTKELKGSVTDIEALFDLAVANNLDVDKYRGDVDKKNAVGRLRMTIGNKLRAAARRRHGLNDLNGDWHDADSDFLAGLPDPTETQDGEKIAAPEPEKEEA